MKIVSKKHIITKEYHSNGTLSLIEFSAPGMNINGLEPNAKVLHRLDGPAYIRYNHQGCKISELYCKNGKRHNVHGPAHIQYDNSGYVKSHIWAINGTVYNFNDWIKLVHLSKVDAVKLKLKFS